MSSTIVFTGGGTAGHVFPGLAIAETLDGKGFDLAWIGSRRGMERTLVEEHGIPFYPISSGKLRRYLSVRNLFDLFNIIFGFLQALHRLRKLKPVLLFSKGGYVSVPPAWAARVLNIPVITHESDVSPGLATRLIMKFAQAIAVSFEDTVDYFPADMKDIVHVCGNPVRRQFFQADPGRGRRFLGIGNSAKVVLVLGGSLGAQQLNAIAQELPSHLHGDCVVVHQTGRHLDEIRSERYISLQFIGAEYPDVLAAADLVVSRAGASTVWEIGALRKPVVLIPLGTASSRGDQLLNARVFERMGVARVFTGNPSPVQVGETVKSLLEDPDLLRSMSESYADFATEGSAENVSRLLVETIAAGGDSEG